MGEGGRGLGELRTVPSMVDLSLEMSGAGWEEFGVGSGVASGQKVVGGENKMTRRGNGNANPGNLSEKSGWRDGGLEGADEAGGYEFEGERDVVKHYDADVLTKVVVYAGIAFVASVICPILFEAVGWGVVPRFG